MRMEHWWFTARLRLRSILLGRRVEGELDEELHRQWDFPKEASQAASHRPAPTL